MGWFLAEFDGDDLVFAATLSAGKGSVCFQTDGVEESFVHRSLP